MKLLLISEYFPATADVDVHGGVEARAYKIAEFLSKKHDVVVLTSREKDKPRVQKIGPLVVKRVGWQREYLAFGIFSELLTRIIFISAAIWYGRCESFDLVEGSSHLGWIPAWILAKIKKKKAVALVADVADQALATYLSVFAFFFLRFYQTFIFYVKWDLFVCISDTVAKKLIRLGVPKNKVQVIYCGTDLVGIKLLKVKKNYQEIVCVSRLVSYKRIADVVYAFKLVLTKLPKAQLTIIGIGDEITSLKSLAHKIGLTNSINFLGFIPRQSDVWRVIKRAGVFCLPSVVEGFGIATVEALAAGVPVVLADMPINHEISRNSGALFFKPYDTGDLARKLIKVMTNKLIRKKLISEAKRVAQLYNWHAITVQTQKVYENLCAD